MEKKLKEDMELYKKQKEDTQKKLDFFEKNKKGGLAQKTHPTTLNKAKTHTLNKENNDGMNKNMAPPNDDEEKNKLRSQISLLRS